MMIGLLFDASLRGWFVDGIFPDNPNGMSMYYVTITMKQSDNMKTNVTDELIGWFSEAAKR